MPVFVTSETSATRHDVFAIERLPPAAIVATGTGTACVIEQFAWGPAQKLTTPDSLGDMLNMIAPPGMDRLGSGYMSVIRKGWPSLKFIRVLGSTAAAATATFASSTPTNIISVALKYPGTAGNSVTGTVAAASDGDSNHFNLTVTVTGPSGTTSDIFQNLNYSGTGPDSAPSFVNTLLVGSITKLASGIPVPGAQTFASGTNGTIDATSYVGTSGSGDKGAALMETDKRIDMFFCGDPGNSIRSTVNTGFVAHADLMTDRFAVINGNSGQTATAAQTDVANFRSTRAVYVDPWVYTFDDTTGAKTLVPAASFVASVAAQLPPSTSIAWKNQRVRSMLDGIVDIEAERGSAAGNNTTAGIVTVIREEDGGFTFEAGKVTAAATAPAQGNLTRTRMGHYIAKSITKSLRGSVDAPNVALNQQDLIDAVTNFMEGLANNAKTDPNSLPHVVAYSIPSLGAFNPQSKIDAGQFTIPLDVKTSSAMEKIFLSFQYGETVNPTVSAK